jgi:hypothetical protein
MIKKKILEKIIFFFFLFLENDKKQFRYVIIDWMHVDMLEAFFWKQEKKKKRKGGPHRLIHMIIEGERMKEKKKGMKSPSSGKAQPTTTHVWVWLGILRE